MWLFLGEPCGPLGSLRGSQETVLCIIVGPDPAPSSAWKSLGQRCSEHI